MTSTKIALIIAVTTVIALPFEAVAQQDAGTHLTIQTTDMTGAVVPNAQLSVMSSEDGKLLAVSANSRGVADLTLQPGEYQYRVASPGFCPQNGTAIVVKLQQQEVKASLAVDGCPSPCSVSCTYVQGVEPTGAPVKIRVSDYSGASIAGALIKIDPSSAIFREIKSDASGEAVVGLPSGMHSLDVTAPGFRHWKGFAEVHRTVEVISAKLAIDDQRIGPIVSMDPVAH